MARHRIAFFILISAILLSSCRPGMGPSLLAAAYSSATPSEQATEDALAIDAVLPAATQAPLPTGLPTPVAEALPTSAPVDTPSPVPTKTTPPTPAATSSLLGFNGFPVEINPLTGLRAPDPSLLNRRPVLVKVSNYPRYGRPHAGLSFADIVFEYYIGEEANRFLAIYYSQDFTQNRPLAFRPPG